MIFEELSIQFRTAKPLILLRADSAPLMLSFFWKVFKDGHITTLTNTELRTKLEGFLEDLQYNQNDNELQASSLFDDNLLKAARYIETWSNAGYLRKYPNDEGEDLHELTSDTLKVMKWIEDLQQREFVGTNSRFKDIFYKLKAIIEQSVENVEARIEDLETKKREIENEITLLKMGKKPSVIDDTEIKEQFYELNKMARELLGDFSEVEQNFEQIRKGIQRKYTEKDVVKGAVLLYALDGYDDINEMDQGKSFKAFWEFLMDELRQKEFGDLTDQLYSLLKDRNIDYNNDRFLKNIKRYLHASGRRVIEANQKMSEKLRRVLAEKSILERRRAIELIGEIRQMAYTLADEGIKDSEFLEIEDEPLLNLIDRWELGEEKTEHATAQFPEGRGGELSAEVDLRPLFDQFTVDKKRLLERINEALQNREQVTLKELADEYGIENGLSEIVGYFSIAAGSSHHIILEGTPDPILLDDRKVNVPMIIYTKPYK